MSKNDPKESREKLINQYRSLWEIKGSRPTRTEAKKTGMSDRQVRKHFGGWTSLQDLSVPDKYVSNSDGKEIVSKYKSLARTANRKQVLQQYQMEEFYNQLSDSLKNLTVKPLQLNKKEINKHIKAIAAPTQIERELSIIFSDLHFGLNIDPEEVGGKNKFGWTEACRRIAHVCKEAASYKLHHRKMCKKLHIAYLGDLINGVINNKAGLDNDLLTHQQCGLYHIIYHSISYLLNFFDEIEVYGIPGNHDRRLHRENGGRVTSQKYDSLVAPIFYALSVNFKGKVKFNLPKTQHVFIDTIGGRLVGAHADTSFSSIGQPGSSINTKALSHQIETFNSGEIKAGNPAIKGVILGHVHNELQLKTQNGIEVLVNSCLSGLDPYAASLTINSSIPSQTIIESTKKYAIGDVRRVRFEENVDDNKDLDKIIPVYNRELSFE